MAESTYRTLKKFPWARTFHDHGPAKDGRCTVTGVPPWHRAEFSIKVQSDADPECWLAACAKHLPPMADDD
jgi:hypothetical protein